MNAVIAFGGGCSCLGTQSCKTIIQKYFNEAFQNDHNNIDAENEISPLVSQVIPSHDFSNAHGGIYLVNMFPS